MSIEELRRKRDEILRIAARHGASNVKVFGSVARGEANDKSDVDLLVELERGRSLMDHAALMIDLEEFLGRRVEIATPRGLKPRIREHVLAEAIPL
jgi:predicted nucleotidyltransferase